VRHYFISVDAEEIIKIQASQTMEDDVVVAWAHERSGNYSVRTAPVHLWMQAGRVAAVRPAAAEAASVYAGSRGGPA
jgi:hypothetical protein